MSFENIFIFEIFIKLIDFIGLKICLITKIIVLIYKKVEIKYVRKIKLFYYKSNSYFEEIYKVIIL